MLAWGILVAALWAAAGHGIYLAAETLSLYGVPRNVDQLGGPLMAAVNAGFFGAVPLAVGVVLAHGRLTRLPRQRLAALAGIVAAAVVIGYGLYGARILAG